MSELAHLEAKVLASLHPECDFESLALEVFDFQRRANPVLAQFAADVQPADWMQIPAVPQVAFKTHALRCFPESETVRTFQTSGTTGSGHGYHHFRSLALYEASILHGWSNLKLPEITRLVLIPESRQVPHSSLSHMMTTLRRLPGEQIEGFTIEGGLLLEKIRHFLKKHETEGKPLMILGTALAFLHLFERLEERGLRFQLPEGSFGWETGGYKSSGRELTKAELYGRFEHSLGLPAAQVINEYGMTELSSQFYSAGLETPHRSPAWLRGLVIHPETGQPCAEGETGFLRLYDLANVGSCLAVETQDLAVVRGSGFELIGRDPSALPRGCSRAADELLRG